MVIGLFTFVNKAVCSHHDSQPIMLSHEQGQIPWSQHAVINGPGKGLPLCSMQWSEERNNIGSVGALACHAAEASPNLAPPLVTLQNHPKSNHTWTLNQRVRMTMRLNLKQAQTQAVTQVAKKN